MNLSTVTAIDPGIGWHLDCFDAVLAEALAGLLEASGLTPRPGVDRTTVAVVNGWYRVRCGAFDVGLLDEGTILAATLERINAQAPLRARAGAWLAAELEAAPATETRAATLARLLAECDRGIEREQAVKAALRMAGPGRGAPPLQVQ